MIDCTKSSDLQDHQRPPGGSLGQLVGGGQRTLCPHQNLGDQPSTALLVSLQSALQANWQELCFGSQSKSNELATWIE